MDAIYFLIPLTFLILVVAIAVFFWAVNNNQYDDLDKEAHRILFDELDEPEILENDPQAEEKS